MLFLPQVMPMWIAGVPATTAPGEPFTVTVSETQCEQYCGPGEGHGSGGGRFRYAGHGPARPAQPGR